MGHRSFGPTRGRRALVSIVTIALAAGAAAGCQASSGGKPSSHDTSTSHSGPYEASSDGKELAVAESGLTEAVDAGGEHVVSYAVILKNPSADTAVTTAVTLSLVDAHGKPLRNTALNGKHTTWDRAVNLIPAGKRQAVTGTTYVDRAGAAKVKIGIKESQWWRDGGKRASGVKVSDVSATAGGKGSATVTYRLDSPYDKKISSANTSAVYRDAHGEILGGSEPSDARPRDYPPGESDGEIDAAAGVPKDLDASHTEVYADPLIELP
ncbi:MAG TPA: hypothetical protein VE172_21825 [Stackebrandtia sp.]|jgi:hypothetical protein|uniref:hypothetical protein n=1 Tax=Stackebrandtia sp. TaxID=2023065 RepID=UPI002D2A1527|nr:hypothetical protein [Stackebrandtia sp.]HZE41449.1 hypothetical protein [Stackebrandtia sp.]